MKPYEPGKQPGAPYPEGKYIPVPAPEALKKTDSVNNPTHYNTGKIEVLEFLEDQGFEPLEWNAVKYICRARWKGNQIEDLKKAIFYLQRAIHLRAADANGVAPLRPNDMKLTYADALVKPSPEKSNTVHEEG